MTSAVALFTYQFTARRGLMRFLSTLKAACNSTGAGLPIAFNIQCSHRCFENIMAIGPWAPAHGLVLVNKGVQHKPVKGKHCVSPANKHQRKLAYFVYLSRIFFSEISFLNTCGGTKHGHSFMGQVVKTTSGPSPTFASKYDL
jgi:hypothetical protein